MANGRSTNGQARLNGLLLSLFNRIDNASTDSPQTHYRNASDRWERQVHRSSSGIGRKRVETVMTFNDNVRQVAALGAAGFIGAMLVIAAASPAHGKAKGPIEVIAHKAPLTTVVPYGDL